MIDLDHPLPSGASVGVCGSVLAGAWVVGTTLVKRQSDLVNEYAEDMAIHVGDERELALCHKEFKKKIGPKLYRESMFKVRGGGREDLCHLRRRRRRGRL